MWVEANSGGGGGGTETETTLWTNQSPSSSFSGGTLSLSDNWTNYSKIAFYYKSQTSSSDSNAAIYRTSDMANWSTSYSVSGCSGSLLGNASNRAYARTIFKTANANEIKIDSKAYALGNSAQNADYCVPTKITGIN